MLPVLLYCISVFTILILYYFYKPDESNNTLKQLNNNNTNIAVDDQTTTGLQLRLAEVDYYNYATAKPKMQMLKRQESLNSAHSSSQNNNEFISIHSNSTCWSSSELSSNSGNRNGVFPRLTAWMRCVLDVWNRFYHRYLFEHLLPVIKYLGLNAHWRREDAAMNVTRMSFACAQQIEDNYKLVIVYSTPPLLQKVSLIVFFYFYQNSKLARLES